jgi:hypothetical protein
MHPDLKLAEEGGWKFGSEPVHEGREGVQKEQDGAQMVDTPINSLRSFLTSDKTPGNERVFVPKWNLYSVSEASPSQPKLDISGRVAEFQDDKEIDPPLQPGFGGKGLTTLDDVIIWNGDIPHHGQMARQRRLQIVHSFLWSWDDNNQMDIETTDDSPESFADISQRLRDVYEISQPINHINEEWRFAASQPKLDISEVRGEPGKYLDGERRPWLHDMVANKVFIGPEGTIHNQLRGFISESVAYQKVGEGFIEDGKVGVYSTMRYQDEGQAVSKAVAEYLGPQYSVKGPWVSSEKWEFLDDIGKV